MSGSSRVLVTDQRRDVEYSAAGRSILFQAANPVSKGSLSHVAGKIDAASRLLKESMSTKGTAVRSRSLNL